MDKLEALLQEQGASIYNFCLYLAKNKQDGEDLFQQTFLRAVELVPKIDWDNNPKSYLLSIAIHKWKNTQQKRSRRQRIAPTVSMHGDETAQYKNNELDIEASVQNKILQESLLVAVNNLDENFRVPLLLFYIEDMKISEIATVLKKPEGTIKRRLHEAKKKLKKELEAQGYE